MEALSGLLGALIGGVLSFVGTYFAHKWNMVREREQWNNIQAAEDKKLVREESKLATTQLFEVYSNAIHYLTMYQTESFKPIDKEYDDVSPISEEEETKRFLDARKNKQLYYLEAQKYLWQLSVKLEDIEEPDLIKFEEELQLFIKDFGGDIEELRNLVVKFARNDKRLKNGKLQLIPPTG
jgi:hypothetical protein